MDEVLKFAVPGLVGAAVTALGFIGRRWMTGAGRHERASLYSNLTDLQSKMKAAGVSFAELDAFEAQLRAKVRETDTTANNASEPSGYWSQAEMNHRAYAALDVEDARLNALLVELGGLVEPAEKDALADAQGAWLVYRDQEAEFAAGEYEGGSIQPLIRASEAASLARERASRIQAFISERRSR